MHQRQLIRNAVVQIMSSIPDFEGRIYPTRSYPIDVNSIPAACVYTLDESSEVETLSPRMLGRRVDLVIEIIVKTIDHFDDVADSISASVESAIGLNQKLNNTCSDSYLRSTKISITGSAEKPTCSLVLIYEVYYRTLSTKSNSTN